MNQNIKMVVNYHSHQKVLKDILFEKIQYIMICLVRIYNR